MKLTYSRENALLLRIKQCISDIDDALTFDPPTIEASQQRVTLAMAALDEILTARKLT